MKKISRREFLIASAGLAAASCRKTVPVPPPGQIPDPVHCAVSLKRNQEKVLIVVDRPTADLLKQRAGRSVQWDVFNIDIPEQGLTVSCEQWVRLENQQIRKDPFVEPTKIVKVGEMLGRPQSGTFKLRTGDVRPGEPVVDKYKYTIRVRRGGNVIGELDPELDVQPP